MKKLITVLTLTAAAATVSACSTTTELTFKDPKTDKVIDKKWVRKDANNPFAPSTSEHYDWNPHTGQVDTEEVVGGQTPVGQVVPVAAAAIGAYGAIEAAKNLEADETNVNASGGKASAQAEGGDAYSHSYSVSHGGNQYQFQAQQQMQRQQQKAVAKALSKNKNLLAAYQSGSPIRIGNNVVVNGGGSDGGCRGRCSPN